MSQPPEKGNSMGKLESLIGQVKNAADKLKGEVYALDTLIQSAYSQRAMLTEEKVSKADFMSYIAEDIRRRGEDFKRKIARLANEGKKDFGTLENTMSNPVGRLPYPYLNGDFHYTVTMTDDAFYWFFPDVIVTRLSDAISDLDWPGDVMPVADRKEAIKKIDHEIETLTAARDDLANELVLAGLAG